ncbi:MAG: hypothetical protein RI911_860 [Candidatus Parcubacteria bacterium]|jgi:hypothetical protein
MKNIIVIGALASLIGGHIAFAQTGTTTQTSDRMAKPARPPALNGACVATAVGVRDDALIAAHNTRNTALTAAIGVRKTEVQAAWNLTESKARRVAREAAWKKFQGTANTTRREFRVAADTAYLNFNKAVKACGVQGYTESAAQDTAVSQ